MPLLGENKASCNTGIGIAHRDTVNSRPCATVPTLEKRQADWNRISEGGYIVVWDLLFTSLCLSTPSIHQNTSTLCSRRPNIEAPEECGLGRNLNGTEGLSQIEPCALPLTDI